MYVYILLGDTYKRTPCVTLDFEKCVPCVGDYRETLVDPSQWFKVLVVGSILIDCDHRVVFWTCEDNVQLFDSKDLLEQFGQQEMLFSNSSCQELDPRLEEFFQTSRDIFGNLSQQISGGNTLTKINEEIVRLIHVFILPEVRFQRKALGSIEKLLQRFEKEEHENIEMLIQMNVQMKKIKEEELAVQRKAFLIDKEIILKQDNPDVEFFETLLKHTQKDIRKLENSYPVSSMLENMPGDPSLHGMGAEAKSLSVQNEIEVKQAFRKDILCTVKQLKSTQKAKQHFRFRTKSKSAASAQFQGEIQKYMKGTAELENILNDLNQNINTKVRLASLREAILLTREEIRTEGCSFGYHWMKDCTGIKTDVLTMIENPKDWSTLYDQLMNSLTDSSSEIKAEHDEFCSQLNAKCKKIKDSLDSGFRLEETPLVSSSSLNDKEPMRFIMRSLAVLCKEVTEHVHKVTELFEKKVCETRSIDGNVYRNVYISYEESLSEEVMPSLSEIYETSLQTHFESLSKWLKQYAKDEVDIISQTMNKLFPIIRYEETDEVSGQRIQALVNSLYARTDNLADSVDKAWKYVTSRATDNEMTLGMDTFTENEPDVKVAFKDFFQMILEENDVSTFFGKLRKLTDATQFLSTKVSELCGILEPKLELTTDDILDVFVLLFCELESEDLLRLYAHVNMCLSLSPDFLRGSINEYCLITINGALQHLFNRQYLHEKRETSAT